MKVEVKIDALSYAKSQTGSYLLVLSDKESDYQRKLPIVINPNDAQFIAVKMNKINITKPMFPDMVKTLTDIYQIDIQEVHIYAYTEGTFFAKVVTTNSVETYDIECSASTALSMAVVYSCPIFVEDEIMSAECFSSDEKGNLIPAPKKEKRKLIGPKIKLEKIKPADTLEDLYQMLEKAVENEDFESAVILRDRIENLKKV